MITAFWSLTPAAAALYLVAVVALAYVVCRRLAGRRCGVCGRQDIPLVERLVWQTGRGAEMRRCCRRCARRIDREERMFARAESIVGPLKSWRRGARIWL